MTLGFTVLLIFVVASAAFANPFPPYSEAQQFSEEQHLPPWQANSEAQQFSQKQQWGPSLDKSTIAQEIAKAENLSPCSALGVPGSYWITMCPMTATHCGVVHVTIGQATYVNVAFCKEGRRNIPLCITVLLCFHFSL